MAAAAKVCIEGAVTSGGVVKAPFRFKPASLYDGQNMRRAEFEWIDVRVNDKVSFARLYWAAHQIEGFCQAVSSQLLEYKKLRNLDNFPKMFDEKGVARYPDELPSGLLRKWAVALGFKHELFQDFKPNAGHVPFLFHDGDSYAMDFADAPELIEGLLPARGIVMVYGPSGSGKTFWALDLSFAVHNGQQWRDKDVLKGDVFYIAAEAGRGIKRRIEGIRRTHPNLRAPYIADAAPNLSSSESVALIVEAVKAIPGAHPAMIIIDTLSASFSGDDSSQKDSAMVVRNLKMLADDLACLVVVIHHPTKSGESWRGSGVWLNDLDVVIKVTTDGPEGQRVHTAMLTKNRDGECGERYLFRLRKTGPLATKGNGKFINTCVVEQLAPDAGSHVPTKLLPTVLKALEPIFSELSIEGPVTFGALLALAKAKGLNIKKFNARRDYARHFNRSEPGDTDQVWFC